MCEFLLFKKTLTVILTYLYVQEELWIWPMCVFSSKTPTQLQFLNPTILLKFTESLLGSEPHLKLKCVF